MKPYKKIYKSKDNKVISGVMGGLGEYFEVDPVVFRVFYLAFSLFSGFLPGVLSYILMAIVIPSKPAPAHENVEVKDESKEEHKA